MVPTRLILQNGAVFHGMSPSWVKKSFFGEVVFSTGMTGYVESLTDPSYAGQILVFTFPSIGNYGVPKRQFWESDQIQVAGVVVEEMCEHPSHHEADRSLIQWLQEENIPWISHIDTRSLTVVLREQGVALGAIAPKGKNIQNFLDPNRTHLVSQVSCKKPILYGKGKKKIIAVDCGMKENILRSLLKFPIEILRVPYDYDYLDEPFDGVFISNGPGDPKICKETIALLKKCMEKKKPIFGICLGAQIMALSIGAKTYKLLYGHRSHNQPCADLASRKCYLTSQNHGYAIDEKSLPSDWEVFFKNLNDDTVEGIRHKELPFFSVQFHPEAYPGPNDTSWLFDIFYQLL
jgi:carbamoyl-phosphate synthase small subunit